MMKIKMANRFRRVACQGLQKFAIFPLHCLIKSSTCMCKIQVQIEVLCRKANCSVGMFVFHVRHTISYKIIVKYSFEPPSPSCNFRQFCSIIKHNHFDFKLISENNILNKFFRDIMLILSV